MMYRAISRNRRMQDGSVTRRRVPAANGRTECITCRGRVLHELGYRLQSVRKTREGTSHPDRNAQFEHINATAQAFLQRLQPVVSVDTKKKDALSLHHDEFRGEWNYELHPRTSWKGK